MVRNVRDLVRYWRTERNQTGKWPVAEITGCTAVTVAAIWTAVALFRLAIWYDLSDWQFAGIAVGFAAVVFTSFDVIAHYARKARRVRRRRAAREGRWRPNMRMSK